MGVTSAFTLAARRALAQALEPLRRDALAGLTDLGIELDEGRNSSADRSARRISSDSSRVAVLVVPTDEELAIARACLEVI